jgi:hypothetical protein
MKRRHVLAATALVVATTAATAGATATPVGPLPKGPTTTISTKPGQLVAFALPVKRSGLVWRVARPVPPTVLRQVSEARVGRSVVLVFRAGRAGTATVSFGLTRGETPRAYESRRYTVRVE